MPRLFVGVPAPGSLDLSGVRGSLEDEGGVKLVDPANYHVTLAFLGDTPEGRVDAALQAIREVVEGTGAHEGRARGLGAFPSEENASVVWTGIEETELDPLANGIRERLRSRSIDVDDRNDFHPHLTLGRLRDKRDMTHLLEPHASTDFGGFPVEQVHLYESTLTPEGPEYEIRGTAELG
ncbi:RNA 2',3'-cyclic phosphodiesterase [Thermoplasmatales archaeon SW_10_69_26]|nr:MAG: RNA 2',3'-cyclic phosphodiesterase [Thermoplasmatales archaeon SW_10_69_26]